MPVATIKATPTEGLGSRPARIRLAVHAHLVQVLVAVFIAAGIAIVFAVHAQGAMHTHATGTDSFALYRRVVLEMMRRAAAIG